MGEVDLNFKPSVPVFDANVALGRRHDRPVKVDTADGTLKEMARVGVERALVYSPHAAAFDTGEGNEILQEAIHGFPNLVPQYVCNPGYDDLDTFAGQVKDAGIRSIRLYPGLHFYPFREWMLGRWLEWLEAERLPVWMPLEYEDPWLPAERFEPTDVYDTLKAHPDINVVLTEVEYKHFTWAVQLLRSLPNIYIELSRWVIIDGVPRLLDAIGDQRVLYGSRFPDGAMGPQLYNLHHHGLSESTLTAICAGNLERLLGMD